MRLFASWTSPTLDLDLARDTGDPLGFKSIGREVARTLVPGITQRSQMVRGFSLLTLGLKLARETDNPNEAWLKFERFIVASQVLHSEEHPDAQGEVPFAGKQKAKKHLYTATMNGSEYPLDEPLLKQQLSRGLWGTYRKAAEYFQLIASGGYRNRTPLNTVLTKPGEELAKLCRKALLEDYTPISQYIQKDSVPLPTLERVHHAADAAPDNEVKLLERQMKEADTLQNGELHALWEAWNSGAGEELSVEGLVAQTTFKPKQQRALVTAATIRELMRKVEAPWRLWIAREVDDNGSEPQLAADVATLPGWKRLEEWGDSSADLLSLQRDLDHAESSSDRMAVVQRHHELRCETLGSMPWERGVTDSSRAALNDYDFCLGALSWLFHQGVCP